MSRQACLLYSAQAQDTPPAVLIRTCAGSICWYEGMAAQTQKWPRGESNA
jgi:hypothetical protein